MANEDVLDASVLLAIIKPEPYDEYILDVLEGAVMSAVNLTEVVTKLLDLGISSETPRVRTVLALLDRIEPFTESQSLLAGDLRTATRHAGLSLGDRACLALGIELGATVHTAEDVWRRVKVDCEIRHIR